MDRPPRSSLSQVAERVSPVALRAGRLTARYGLVLVLAWIGLGKLVHFGAADLLMHSPLMSWILDVVSPATFGRILGCAEILAALLIALSRWPLLSAAGSALATALFVGTISFLFTTPGVVGGHLGPIPTLTERPGQFLLKDVVLIGVAIWTLGQSLSACGGEHEDAAPLRTRSTLQVKNQQ